jgi:hypothetical protein
MYGTLNTPSDKENPNVPTIFHTCFTIHSIYQIDMSLIHVTSSLHSIDCNLADGEYILVPEQGVAQEVV